MHPFRFQASVRMSLRLLVSQMEFDTYVIAFGHARHFFPLADSLRSTSAADRDDRVSPIYCAVQSSVSLISTRAGRRSQPVEASADADAAAAACPAARRPAARTTAAGC